MHRALVVNGTFLEVLDQVQEYMSSQGLEALAAARPGEPVTAAQVHELASDVAVIFGPGPGLNAALFAHAPQLRVIASAASGYESIDVGAATRAGVAVVNAPAQAGSEAVADIAFGLMLSVARDIPRRHQMLIAEHKADRTMGFGIWEKTLGIIGLGSIGQATARRATGFNMRILCYNRSWNAEHQEFATRYGATRTDLETLLRESDYISLHLRATPETENILNAKTLAWVKPTSVLINTARANLVEESALYAALTEGRLAGAGLDVLVDRGFDTPLLGLPNVVGTPHLGNRCVDSIPLVMRFAVDQAVTFLQGGRPTHLINPEILQSAIQSSNASIQSQEYQS
jgi:phosphoglycerate dehydrogenase-like enzyme